MDTRLLVAIISLIGALSVAAQSADVEDGVTVRDETAYRIMAGQLAPLAEVVRFDGGIEIQTNGTFKVAGGNERKLEDGQVLRSDGWLVKTNGLLQPIWDHVVMVAGSLTEVRDGKDNRLTEQLVLTNHLTIFPDTRIIYPNGIISRMYDGQLFLMDGTPIPSRDAATMRNGRVIVYKDGSIITLKLTQPQQATGMNDGTLVRADGMIRYRDGHTFQLREGQTLFMEGRALRWDGTNYR